MNFKWADERCIICALPLMDRQARCDRTATLTKEHLIPEAIGGRLTCDFLCKHCNSILGELEALVKRDSGIHVAIDNLKTSLPDLWATMADDQPCIGEGPGGKIEGRIKNGTFTINSSQRADGSLIRPLTAAVKTVQPMLERRGATEGEISNAATTLENLPEGSRVRVADGIEILKSTPIAVHPVLSSQRVEPRALIKIAYEYLALHLGEKIFDPYFDTVRSGLTLEGVIPSCCSVEENRVQERKYQSFHGLAGKKEATGLIVKIRLFGYLSYPVRFFGPQLVPTQLHCYTLHLDSKEEEWVQIDSV